MLVVIFQGQINVTFCIQVWRVYITVSTVLRDVRQIGHGPGVSVKLKRKAKRWPLESSGLVQCLYRQPVSIN